MKSFLIVFCFFLLTNILSSDSPCYAQTQKGKDLTGQTEQTEQQSPPPIPDITPAPRSKLEIIQYILLPFAIGASIWMILKLDKIEQQHEKNNKED